MTPEAFCNPFDASLGNSSVPAIFLKDRSGFWRFDARYTRDTVSRVEGEIGGGPGFVLLRDTSTGFVWPAYVTQRQVLVEHPRLQSRFYDTEEQAFEALAAFGSPAMCETPW